MWTIAELRDGSTGEVELFSIIDAEEELVITSLQDTLIGTLWFDSGRLWFLDYNDNRRQSIPLDPFEDDSE